MIRIKDYIFQEKDIKQIWYNSEYNKLFIRKYESRYDTEIPRATFEDIEWNYGSQEQCYNEETEQLISKTKLENYKLKDRINQLEEEHKELVETNYDLATKKAKIEEENKRLKELNVCVGCDNNPDYKSRIDKAIEYINKFESIKAYFEYTDEDGYDEYDYDDNFRTDLFKILKGEE